MSRNSSWKTLSFGCGVAMVLAAACGGNKSADETSNAKPGGAPAADSARAPESVVLVGCVQRGDGRNEFILTEANRQAAPVGTSGADAGRVQREQEQAAEKSYRLSGDSDDLTSRVGKQVKVTGTVADRDRNDRDRDVSRVDANDLAVVTVASIEPVSDACGQAGRQ
jgi:hypothetical protein